LQQTAPAFDSVEGRKERPNETAPSKDKDGSIR
jgi:hypothetical protein